MQNEIDPQVKPYRSSGHPIDPAFLNRWSPRAFSPEPIDDAALMSVFEAARWAASSYNAQPWRFILARSEEDRRRFVDFLVPGNQGWAKNAPALFLIIAKKTFDHNGEPNIVSQYDAGTCSGYAALQASLNGLVMHGMVGFDHDRAREALGIPEEFDLLAVYAVGKQGDKSLLPPKVQERELPSGRRPLTESLMEGRFRPA